MNEFPRASTSSRCRSHGRPVSASTSSGTSSSATHVRSRNSLAGAPCLASTSLIRYSATFPTSPRNSSNAARVSARAARLIAANRTPAGHPPVRACSTDTSRGARSRPSRRINAATSAVLNARSAARISVISPSRRYRFNGSGGSDRVNIRARSRPPSPRDPLGPAPGPPTATPANSPQSRTHTTGAGCVSRCRASEGQVVLTPRPPRGHPRDVDHLLRRTRSTTDAQNTAGRWHHRPAPFE